MTGYLHERYAASLAEFGTPRELRHSGGWILVRQIAGTALRDGMGLYPLFVCRDWSKLHLDLDELNGDLVSVCLVTDPFGQYDTGYLRECFPDVFIPFKKHFVTDLTRTLASYVPKHHQRNTRRAFKGLSVMRSDTPLAWLEDWVNLYSGLIERHNIRGIVRFSPQAFAEQLAVPGIVAFRASYGDSLAGMGLWYVHGAVAYYHLAAFNALGYEMRASYAIFWSALEYLGSQGVHWLDLGAGAGIDADGQDGLTRFKKGWSSTTRQVYFCGRILNHGLYDKIVTSTATGSTQYFPAYRLGEFR